MDNGDRADLLRRLFVLIGLEAEELEQLAIEGQDRNTTTGRQRELAARARDVAEKVLIVADASTAVA